MLNNQTITTLTDLGLKGMADAFREQLESVQYLELSFAERFAMLVDREAMDREARRLATRLRAAKLRHQASIEDLDFHTPRGLERSTIMGFSSSHWVDAHQNILVTGPTGIGNYVELYIKAKVISGVHLPTLGFDLVIVRCTGGHQLSLPI
ncbi:transposase [Ferrimicrobium acidiphilum DSM 19497]|uniref:Transposase n=1 Tax=Ferrimicrobium acidiphilum DSM 19497 TaxID=1121877 RepID=A0A0D8FQK7_9ACTN|nr:transposase [Ferrimicrobium acidiphilum DSM 19497]